MSRLRLLFASGIAVCVFGGALAFGLTATLAVIGAGATVLTIINAFLAHDASKPENAVLQSMREVLARRAAAISTTTILWIAGTGFFGYAGYERVQQRQLLTLRGTVLHATGRPAVNVVVRLKPTGTIHVTDDRGFFEFAGVRRPAPAAPLSLVAEWGRLHSKPRAITRDGPVLRSYELRLPPEDPPFRITYLTLIGPAFDLFVQANPTYDWEPLLTADPFVHHNEVFMAARRISNQFRVPADLSDLTLYSSFAAGSPGYFGTPVSLELLPGLFVGSSGPIDADDGSLVSNLRRYATPDDFENALRNPAAWRVFPFADPEASEGAGVGLRRSAKASDLRLFESDPLIRFTNRISGGTLPPDFGFVTLTDEADGCGDVSSYLSLVLPRLALRVAVIETAADDPVVFKRFAYRVNPRGGLRSSAADLAAKTALPLRWAPLYPPERLNADERIVVPTSLVFLLNENYSAPTITSLDGLRDALGGRSTMRFAEYSAHIASAQPLLEAAAGDDTAVEYVWGPSCTLEEIELADFTYQARTFYESSNIFSRDGPMGSCPFVLTQDSGGWHTEGVILASRDSAAKRGKDRRRLRHFNGNLVIEERELEVSHLDSVSVRASWPDGTSKLLSGRCMSRVCPPVALHPGDRVRFRYELPARPGAEFDVEAEGYFESLPQAVETRTLRPRPPYKHIGPEGDR